MHMCVRPLTVVQMQREAKGVWTVGGIGECDDRLGCWSAADAHLAVYLYLALAQYPSCPFATRARALFLPHGYVLFCFFFPFFASK